MHLCIKSSLTSDVREILSSFPTVWTSERMPFMLFQAGIAVDPPTAHHLVGGASHKKGDLAHQFVWWCLHKLAVIPTNRSLQATEGRKMTPSIGSHHLQRTAQPDTWAKLGVPCCMIQISDEEERFKKRSC